MSVFSTSHSFFHIFLPLSYSPFLLFPSPILFPHSFARYKAKKQQDEGDEDGQEDAEEEDEEEVEVEDEEVKHNVVAKLRTPSH